MANKKNTSTITSLNDEDLLNELKATQTKLIKMRFGHAISPLDNPTVLKETRKEVARIKTEINKRKSNPTA